MSGHSRFWSPLSLRSLRMQLLLWIALPVAIGLFALSLTELRSHERAMQRLVQERADNLTRAAASLIAVRLDREQDRLAQMAVDPVFHSPDRAAWVTLLTRDAVGWPAGVAIYDEEGRLLATAGATNADGWLSAGPVRGLVRKVTAGRAPGAVTLARDGESPLLVLAVPLPGASFQGQRALVGATTVSEAALLESLQPLSLGPNTMLVVETAEGTPLMTAGSAVSVSGDTDKIVTVTTTVEPPGWRVTLHESWAELAPPILRFESVVFLVVAMGVVISLLSAYFGLRNIVQPLRKLDEAASLVGWGDFDTIQQPVGGVQEIEDLRLALARMAAQIRQYQQKLQSYIGAMTLGQEEERKRLARDLHDETVQALIALNQQVELTERRLARDPEGAAARLRELRPLIAETIADLRRLIHDLRPLYLEDLGFVPALEMLVRQTAERYDLIGDFEVAGEPRRRLAPAVEIGAFRIVQEALHNVATHARASWVHVELIFDPGGVTLRVEDDGVGFDAPSHPYRLAQTGHYGLLGMQERAQLHDGELHIESEIGRGTTVTAWLACRVESQIT